MAPRRSHPGSARLYDDHPLASAESKAPEPNETSLGHRRADHPERPDRDRTIGIDVVRAVEIDRIDVDADEVRSLKVLESAKLG